MEPELRRLTDAEVAAGIAELADWQVVDGKLQREFKFASFIAAIDFIDRAAIWAETWDHHPEWSNVYNRVQVVLWTHDVGGISHLDFQLANKMNELTSPGLTTPE